MMASAVREKYSWGGGLRMTVDWIPGAAIALAGSLLSFLRQSAVTDERIKVLTAEDKRIETEGRRFAEERVAAVREEVTRIDNDSRQFQKDINAELHETLGRMDAVFTELKVLSSTQAAFNQMCTKTLEGMAKKFEYHDQVMMQQHTDIEVLKVANKC
jgi:hypothetical protein